MAESTAFTSSQETLYDHHLPSSQTFASSPPSPTSSRPVHSKKPKKPPPITPKRFNKFFTPRTSSSSISQSRSGRQLRDITRNAVNRRRSPRRHIVFSEPASTGFENCITPKLENNKKRKLLPSPESSPVQPSPSKKSRAAVQTVKFDIAKDVVDVDSDAETTILELEEGEEEEEEEEEEEKETKVSLPIRRAPSSSTASRLLQRLFGGRRAIGRGRVYDHCTDWQSQTSNFYSRPEDLYSSGSDLPFCTASCNTNSLVAIGDEDGSVSLLESAKDSTPPFSQAYIKLRPHSNAVMDLAFSSDDFLLATASGDQTGHVIDVRTQQSTYVMGGQGGHHSSVKQVCFQPGNDNVIATSSRDGTVRLWDLRCSGSEGAIKDLRVAFDGSSSPSEQKITYASTYNTISSAHAERQAQSSAFTVAQMSISQKDGPWRNEAPGRRGDVSITALSFLNVPGREHLLLTASEASTAVKLWDIRGRYNRRAMPISTTSQPESHSKHRHFGINSLSLSGDGGRLYALSRDNTIYAYSTAHLVLGSAPELSGTVSNRKKQSGTDKIGLGPLYGFRHERLHATSFWVKTSLRKAVADKTEMLAVGSSDGCPILFPTDERTFKWNKSSRSTDSSTHSHSLLSDRPSTKRSTGSFSARMADTVPIYDLGTPLVRGHQREVTSLTWTSEGELVSIGDDYTARCWRECQREARELRNCGESEGRRWGCGWSEMRAGWDDDDDDE
ncbi:uncharacterized protein K452DRAFT_360949 [Aplosporella prunicola CBS 121167]|uniref:Uncharacterized protein n=1 Tax=Aplosporella prunicola CBS 121167 TaxID=1176127 RepID=A0A6A6B7D3_9PEZI|nr:uncharacterized protein K452DRAFT_360949 [Aplosporella prunicola CBS 121167]KAF2138711.1 hypothetical protein K452DRAFT_360949 [Aplosporella prunicola CBS 121167]